MNSSVQLYARVESSVIETDHTITANDAEDDSLSTDGRKIKAAITGYRLFYDFGNNKRP